MKRLLIFCCIAFIHMQLFGQASFTAPDTVCINQPVNITNTSVGASTYYWNFCGYNLYGTPTLTNLGNPGGYLSVPTFIAIQEDNGVWYGFVTNYINNHLIRLTYGNSFLNTPQSEDLGNFGGNIPQYTEGVQIVKDSNGWHAIIVGGYTIALAAVMKIDFGASLGTAAASLTSTNWGNVGASMDLPTELTIIKEGNNYYGLTVNANSNTVTRLSWGPDFSNAPTATNLGNITGTLYWPTGIYAANYNGNNYVFVTSSYGHNLVRLDFGNSITNTPTGTDLGNPNGTLTEPRDLCIINDCGNFYGYVINYVGNDVVRVDFPSGIAGPVTGTTLNMPGFDFPHAISTMFRGGNSMYAFITDANKNNLFRMQFDACSNSTTPSSTLATPPAQVYDAAGTYNIHLLTNESLSSQTSYCKEVVVLDLPKPQLGNDTLLCSSAPGITLDAGDFKSYIWNTGATTRTIVANATGDYIVTVSNGFCTGKDTVHVEVNTAIDLSSSVVTNIQCGSPDGQLDIRPVGGVPPYLYYLNGNPKGAENVYKNLAAGTYTVLVYDAMGCSQTGVYTITEDPATVLQISAGGTNLTCYDGSNGVIRVQVFKGIGPFEYSIDNFQTSQDSAVFTGLEKGTYTVYVQNGGCKDSVKVTLTAPSQIYSFLPVDPETCGQGNGIWRPSAWGGTPPYQYYWNGQLISSSDSLTGLSAGTYHLTIVDGYGCRLDTEITVENVNLPAMYLWNKDTTINIGESVVLHATNAADYAWTPVEGLSCADCGTTIATPLQTTTYVVTTPGGANCVGADSVTIKVTNYKHLYIPTAFSPNGDGQNDVFKVKAQGVAYIHMRLYNRWGNVVYEGGDVNSGWDGYFGSGKAPAGSYVYMVEYAFYGEEKSPKLEKGVFTLVR